MKNKLFQNSDEYLVSQYINGEESALETLINRYQQKYFLIF